MKLVFEGFGEWMRARYGNLSHQELQLGTKSPKPKKLERPSPRFLRV